MKLTEALEDRTSFRRFCGSLGTETTPERTAFVRFSKELVAQKPERVLFMAVTTQLKSKAVTVKIGTLVEATIIRFANEDDNYAHRVSSTLPPSPTTSNAP